MLRASLKRSSAFANCLPAQGEATEIFQIIADIRMASAANTRIRLQHAFQHRLRFIQLVDAHEEQAHRAHRIDRLGMLGPEHVAVKLERLLIQGMRPHRVSLIFGYGRQMKEVTDVLRMSLTSRSPVDAERLLQEFVRRCIVAPVLGDSREIVQRERQLLMIEPEAGRTNLEASIEQLLSLAQLASLILNDAQSTDALRSFHAVGARELLVHIETLARDRFRRPEIALLLVHAIQAVQAARDVNAVRVEPRRIDSPCSTSGCARAGNPRLRYTLPIVSSSVA